MWLFLILSLLPLILASSITNGTCYYKAGELADDIYSPCGNTIDGQWPCCQLGDKCNNYNTCTWVSAQGIIYTYVAGCTDPDYEDASCPNKGEYSDYQWVGLAWNGCNPDSNGIVNWDGCNNDGSAEVSISPESANCTCDDDDTPLFRASVGLVAEGFLPTTKMGQISWLAGYLRTDPVAPSTSSSSSSSVSTVTLGSPTTRRSATATSSSSPHANTDAATTNSSSDSAATAVSSATEGSTNNAQQGDPHAGEKAGLAVSGALVGCIAIGAMVFFLYQRRRTKKQAKEEQPTLPFDNKPQDQEKHIPTITSIPATLNSHSIQHNSTLTNQRSELPGSPADPSLMSITASPDTNAAHPTPPKNEYDVYYQPYRYRNPSASTSPEIGLASGSPVTMRSDRWQSSYQPYRPSPVQGRSAELAGDNNVAGTPARNDQVANVHELPGCSPDEFLSRDTSDVDRDDGRSIQAGL